MPQRKHRFQAPPSQDPLSGAKSSLVFRLNFGFFFRQLVIFLVMDLLLLFMATAGCFSMRRTGAPRWPPWWRSGASPPPTPSPGWRPATTPSSP